MAKHRKTTYFKYADELKKILLQDDIKILKVYGDDDTCIEYKRVVYGCWDDTITGEDGLYCCSACKNFETVDGGLNFCPNCGADMRDSEHMVICSICDKEAFFGKTDHCSNCGEDICPE